MASTAENQQLWMKALVRDIELARAKDVRATDKHLIVDLVDGRTITVPLEWYPRLMNGTPKERRNWGFHASGEGTYWPDLDEDLSVEGLLAGRPSGESQKSFQRWLKGRKAQRKTRGRKA